MTLELILGYLAAFVHAHAEVVSVASALVIIGLIFGDVEDFVLYGLQKGWRALVSINVVFGILAGDVANVSAGGIAALAFMAALGAGASYRDAGVAALVAIGTVNTGFLLGADRQKLQLIISALSSPTVRAQLRLAPRIRRVRRT